MSHRLVMVTGGAGFIGSHVAEGFLARGDAVHLMDDLSSGSMENLPSGAIFHEVDVCSDAAGDVMREVRPEILVHHAAQINVRRSVEDPGLDAEVNIGGLLNLLEAGRTTGLKTVVFASTGGAIYGEQKVFPADEEHQVWPVSPYGVAKLACEKYLFYYHAIYGIDVTCLRYANVYGPRQNPHGEAGVVAIFCNKLLAGERPVIFGDGQNTRDYVYVSDVVDANIAVANLDGYNVMNVGTGVETSVLDIFGRLRDVMGVSIEPLMGEARAGEQRRSSISSDFLEKMTGVRPETDLLTGLGKTLEWCVEHK